jgi:hypothetical protein|tara:strand:+ start:147 stop:398 length:252 start_codon:yes stop_codon:yes gene_type:complete
MNHVDKNHEKLVKLMGSESPESRQELLNEIDTILCDYLEFKRGDLPWINVDKQEENWDKLMRRTRLVVARIHLQNLKKLRTLH